MGANRLLLGTRKGLVTLRRGPGGWALERLSHAGVPVPYAVRDPRDGVLWASLDHGHWGAKLSRSRDDGASWGEVAAPVWPEGAEREPGVAAKLEQIWVIAPGRPEEPGRIWLGTNPGGLFESVDGGDRFTLVSGLWDHPSRAQWMGGGRDTPGLHSVVLDPRDPSRMLVGISVAGVFETIDGGQSWVPRNRGLRADFLPDPGAEVGQDPHCVVACPSDPDALGPQNPCGVWRSVAGGASWLEVSAPGGPACFGFPIAVHEARPEVAWVVPAAGDTDRAAVGGALCVSRTEDGGRSWTALRQGLPQSLCFDLVYRHALDLSGDTLAFGSTTGNLFVSDDGGEGWQVVAHHLPPIYSVRFAD